LNVCDLVIEESGRFLFEAEVCETRIDDGHEKIELSLRLSEKLLRTGSIGRGCARFEGLTGLRRNIGLRIALALGSSMAPERGESRNHDQVCCGRIKINV
jgi:hypothetical protein